MKIGLMGAGVGGLIALMIHTNGTLGNYTNVYFSSFVVHIIATIGVLAILPIVKSKTDETVELPFYYYCGGILGSLIIVLNNISFKELGVSVTVALVFFGQVVISLFIDSYGLLNMKKIPFNKRKIPGLLLITIGVFAMTLM
ncbi:MAG: DMT family transporter [Clostridiaceae bacterium]|nr:DMT family transporter [Clostridiaceae bacterium]